MSDTLAAMPDATRCLALVTEALFLRLRQEGRTAPRITLDADLVELGLVDSQALLDIILDVEQKSGALFNADRIDFESGMTLRHLAAAFADGG